MPRGSKGVKVLPFARPGGSNAGHEPKSPFQL
jgi:hypothetical protein